MASLMDDLTDVLDAENKLYKKLLVFADEMKDAVIKGDVPKVEEISAAEENVTNDIQVLEGKRIHIMKDMAAVINVDVNSLKVAELENTLSSQPELKERLRRVRTELKNTMMALKAANDMNQVLLKQAMELLDFDLTLYRSTKQAPQTANYGRNAYSTGELLGQRGFDAKQ